MAKPRMDLTACVGKLLEEQDGDVLREGIRVLSQALMESESRRLDRRRAPRAQRRPHGVSQWEPDTDLGPIELAGESTESCHGVAPSYRTLLVEPPQALPRLESCSSR